MRGIVNISCPALLSVHGAVSSASVLSSAWRAFAVDRSKRSRISSCDEGSGRFGGAVARSKDACSRIGAVHVGRFAMCCARPPRVIDLS
jgi:hypothetical protein